MRYINAVLSNKVVLMVLMMMGIIVVMMVLYNRIKEIFDKSELRLMIIAIICIMLYGMVLVASSELKEKKQSEENIETVIYQVSP